MTATLGRKKAATASEEPALLDGRETIVDVLGGFRRQVVPIRKTFVQKGKGKETQPGPLASFVTRRDEKGLDAYLLIHALASAEPWDCTMDSGFWVRTLDLVVDGPLAARTGAVSKIMKRLADRDLITRGRVDRKASLTLLKEDGSGDPYERPRDRSDQWFRLPHEYWYDNHYRELGLKAKAMLLIALERPPTGFYLPENQAFKWYGISADSAGDGLRELHNRSLIKVTKQRVRTPRSATGWTEQRIYTLAGTFAKAAYKDTSRKASKAKRSKVTKLESR